MLIGYARVAPAEQDPDRQVDALARAGVERDNIHVDTAGGARASRPRLDRVLEFARAGDTLVVTRLDRIGRSVPHLVALGAALRSRDIGLRVLEQGIDTATEPGRAMFGMFSVLEQVRHDLAAANTREGRAMAAARGRPGGRPPKLTPERARIAQRLYDEGAHTVAQIAEQLGVKRGTLYGYLDKSTLGNRPRARKNTPIQSLQQAGSLTPPGADDTEDSATAPPSTEISAPPERPRLVDTSHSAQRPGPANRPAKGPGPTNHHAETRPRITVIPGSTAPANPATIPQPATRPAQARHSPTRHPPRPGGTTCPNCGYRPTHFRDRIRQRQDLALVWLYPDPDQSGRVVERRHCAECQPHERVASVECAHCADGPLLAGSYAAAPDGLPELIRRWLTARGWHIDGPRWTCPRHRGPHARGTDAAQPRALRLSPRPGDQE